MTMFSQRTHWPLSSNRITQTLDALRRDRVEVIDLTESNPTRCGFRYPARKILRPFTAKGNLFYNPQSQGAWHTREAVCRYYKNQGHTLSAQRVFLTASTSEAYSYIFQLLSDPGQEILFPQPSYPLFQFLGDLNSIILRYYPLVYTDSWRIDIQAMEDAVGPQARAIVLVNPNNPTGSFINQDELGALNRLCRQRNMALICDEVFNEFTFVDDKPPLSLVGCDTALTFILGGLSKTLGLPQMKLGWIIVNGPAELADAACQRLEVIADTYLSVNTPVQNAAVSWFCLKEELQGQIRQRIRGNWKFLRDAMHGAVHYGLLNAEGGWYAVMRTATGGCEEDLVCTLLEKDHVYVHPGYFFDFDPSRVRRVFKAEGFLVVSLLPRPPVFQEGIARLTDRLATR